MFSDLEKEIRKQLFSARLGKYLLLIVLLTLSLSVTLFGLYVTQFAEQSLKQVAYTMIEIARATGKTPGELSSPESIAGLVGNNTMWVPIVGGITLAFLAIVYLFRICTIRVSLCEDRLLGVLTYRDLVSEKDITPDVKASILAQLSVPSSAQSESPSLIPTVEIAEKSIDSLSNIVSKATVVSSKLRGRT
ncbi:MULTISPECIES: hypothetical protein [Vibrio harveyi group]|uniref:hypothetical protein n=1 Tax=Vibrio harveyi group TaxID=717610 RepID=UPI000DF37327|nr:MULTISPECIES: hypothetical protein [Vibrio harveyi group]MBM4905600.1 hypothetical protein [Vibrio parahaemolyticus]RCR59486.1 hypothetical protein DTW68_22595 [Vibrio harveyi]